MTVREKSIVVDENDNIIGYKYRDEITPSDRMRITGVWVEDGKGNVLIAKRHKDKKIHPGLWGPATAGSVAHDETYESNAYKEIKEEIGVSGVALEFVEKSSLDMNGSHSRFVSWYRAVIDWPISRFTIQPEEVEEIKWVNKSKLFEDLRKQPEIYVPTATIWIKLFS